MGALTAAEVKLRLLARGILGMGSGVDVQEIARRNRSFIVTGRERAFFVKQNVDGPVALGREAAIYRRAMLGSSLPFASHLPRLHFADRRVLVLDLIAGARSLTELASRGRPGAAVAAAVGSAVAKIHATGRSRFHRARRPWILDLTAPSIEILRDASAANREIIRIVQESAEFSRHLDVLRSGWRATTLVHRDLRSDNVLIRRGGRRTDVWIVDWEHSGAGDPAWDVGSVIASLLVPWVLSLPFVPGMTVNRTARAAAVRLEQVRPGIRAFWSSYVAARSFTRRHAHPFLLRAIRFAGARLLQHAWEQSQSSLRVRGEIVCTLQLSLNALAAPERVAGMLVGRAR